MLDREKVPHGHRSQPHHDQQANPPAPRTHSATTACDQHPRPHRRCRSARHGKGYGKGGIANQGIANGIVSTRINQFTTAERAHLPDTEHATAARHDQQQHQEEREHDKSMLQELKRSLLEQKERDEYQMLQVQNEQHRILQESEAQHKLQLDEVVRGVESRAAEVAQRVAEQAAQAQGAAPTAAGSQGSPEPAELKSQYDLMRLEIEQMKIQAAGDVVELHHRVNGLNQTLTQVVTDTQDLAAAFSEFRKTASEDAMRRERAQNTMKGTLDNILDQMRSINSQTVTAQATANSAGTHATQSANATAELLKATLAEREKAHEAEIRELESRIRIQERKKDLEKENNMAPELPAAEGGHRAKLSATRTHAVDKAKA